MIEIMGLITFLHCALIDSCDVTPDRLLLC